MAYACPGQRWCVRILFYKPLYAEARDARIDVDFDPAKKARDERKARVEKNQKQQEKNLARAQQQSGSTPAPPPPTAQRKREIERTVATTRMSTASMGRFDRKLDGEKKLKGVKRKVRTGCLLVRSTAHLPCSLIPQKCQRKLSSHKTWQFCQNLTVSPKPRSRKRAATFLTYGKLFALRVKARAAQLLLGMRTARRVKKASDRLSRIVVCQRVFATLYHALFLLYAYP